MSAQTETRWFRRVASAPVDVAVEVPAGMTWLEAFRFAKEAIKKAGFETKDVLGGDWIPRSETPNYPRYWMTLHLERVAPVEEHNTDGDVKSDKLTGGAA